ncbi:hypothetical protein EDWATA_03324 [Edwardsiella tarda ATCC 23685]|uniref:Uncharacterized protein n=1 Tax=Edwardsiella tarda ATCC 23685 TaxID=500638 RepID=D4F969_EDWTA|nr:hypothetical protein EDWATA_03324 [Edwardsiella tarda ATCC 23685]
MCDDKLHMLCVGYASPPASPSGIPLSRRPGRLCPERPRNSARLTPS